MVKEPENGDILDLPESYQRYLDEIYSIASKKKKGGWVSNKEIADALAIKPASVSGMLNNLKKEGLIQWERRKSIRLTKLGKEVAEHLNEVHALLNDFFEKVLKITDKKVINDLSCQIEHHISQDVKDSIIKFLDKYLNQ